MSKVSDANAIQNDSPGNQNPPGALLCSKGVKNRSGFKFNGLNEYTISDESFAFSPEKTFECGQCFRFNRTASGSYEGVLDGRLVSVSGKNGYAKVTVIEGPCDLDFSGYLDSFFDVSTDYSKLSSELSAKDDVMKEAVTASFGIRLLRQDFFETVISFIVSANNNIPRIKKCIESICLNYGKNIGGKAFAFPVAETLSKVSGEELAKVCRVGYRGPYIANTARLFAEGKADFEKIKALSLSDKYKTVLSFPGVGPKVLNCIMLFSGLDRSAFPVDVWVERMMNELYGLKDTDRNKLEKYGKEYFGDNAGLAQQYLFYYIRQIHGK